jgi:hypothetical protein
MNHSVLCINAGIQLLYPCIPIDIRILLLVQCHAEYHIKICDIGDDNVDCLVLLRSGAVLQAYCLAYGSCSMQRLAINSGNRHQQLPFPHNLQTEPICYGLEAKVVSGPRVNEG